MTPRGIRNNNPGNIRHSSVTWDGQSEEQPDEAFVSFDDPVMGIRAMSRILRTYRTKYNLKTIRGIIERWAPPHENDTEAYIQFITDATACGESDILDEVDYVNLVRGIIKMENGQNPYTSTQINKGVRLGLGAIS